VLDNDNENSGVRVRSRPRRVNQPGILENDRKSSEELPPFRGKARLQEWLLPRRGEVRAKVFGVEMDLDLSYVIQRDIYAGPTILPKPLPCGSFSCRA
jgi:hypothetical protein